MQTTESLAATVFLGRAGDRNRRGMAGAAKLSAALSNHLGVGAVAVGEPLPPIEGGWEAQLEAARPGLLRLRNRLAAKLATGAPTLTVAGRCAASLATLPAVAKARPNLAIAWFDAHADLNEPDTTATGYLGGMVLTGAAGLWDSGLGAGLDLSRVVLAGVRDIDPPERAMMGRHGIRHVPPGRDFATRLRAALAGRPAYLHVDCDVLEPGQVPSEYAVPGGITLETLRESCVALAESGLGGIELAEFEAEWPDGRSGDPAVLLAALEPALEALIRA
ncbi:arginase family protein [Sabulicella glaciei]|uniref:Arginase family protein n=1 Tax=Sabulicella glaciei TaxID=2984948 RepID=A0ABT3P0S0_9PROT|nr:arginase family protein [Roseococcus sp. MDT2-1-1]MCW8088003.1 arginase family protein [Roseococcus sp. MDT2-1-1]